MIAASAAMSHGNPNRSTIGPPTNGPMKAPIGFAPFTIPNANAMRPAGACSARVARIRPVLPETERLDRARDREEPDVRRECGEQQGDERHDERSDDQRLAPVAVGERAPERKERHAGEVRERRDGADPESDRRELDAEARQVQRRECGDLAVRCDLEKSGDREEDRHAYPAGNWPLFHRVSNDTRRV